MRLCALALALLVLLLAGPAEARRVQYSPEGKYIATLEVPSRWSNVVGSAGSLDLASENDGEMMVLSIMERKRGDTPDSIATGMAGGAGNHPNASLAEPPRKTESSHISGYPAEIYHWAVVRNRVRMAYRLAVVLLDQGHVLLFSRMTLPKATPQNGREAEGVIKSLSIKAAAR